MNSGPLTGNEGGGSVPDFDQETLLEIYGVADGSLTRSRGDVSAAVKWAAGVLNASDRTVYRWLGGAVEGRPTRAHLAQLRVAAETSARARRFRERRSDPSRLKAAREWADNLDHAALEEVAADVGAERRRALRSPTYWRTWSDWARARRKAGLSTPRKPRREGWIHRTRRLFGRS